MQRMATCLWFDGKVEEAAKFYKSVFRGSKILNKSYYGDEGFEIHGHKSTDVLTITMKINGHEFQLLNGGPLFKFNEAISLVVYCKTQKELDKIWSKLSSNKASEQCGWLKDKYGLSWQIVPTIVEKMMLDKDKKRKDRVMKAILHMKRLDIAGLKKAYAGK